MKFRNQIILLLFVLGFSSVSQGQSKIDSLDNIWQSESNDDSTRIYALWDLAWEYLMVEPDIGESLGYVMYDFAEERNWKQKMGQAENTIGVAHFFRGETDDAITHYKKAGKIFAEIKDYPNVSGIAANLGMIESSRGNYVEALESYEIRMDVNQMEHDTVGMIQNIQNIFNVYLALKDYDMAMKWLDDAEELHADFTGEVDMEGIYQCRAMIYEQWEEWDKAEKFYLMSLESNEKAEDMRGISIIYNNLGSLYMAQGEVEKGLDYLLKCQAIREESNFRHEMSYSLTALSTAYIKLDDFKKAEEYALRGLEIARETNIAENVRSAAETLEFIYEKQGRYREAHEMLSLFNVMDDSLENLENEKAAVRMQIEHDFEQLQALEDAKHELEIEHQKEVAAANDSRNNLKIIFISVGLLVVVIFCFFLFNRFKITRKQNEIIEQQKLIVEHKNEEITDSITYAKRIQNAILPDPSLVNRLLPDNFILYEPKDIVAGDFYWIHETEDDIIFAVADCTGHGVPGAMVSVICSNAMNRAVREYGLSDPGKILDKTNELVEEAFLASRGEVKDGMDIALCSIRRGSSTVRYAGAHNPLWIIRNGSIEIEEVKADKFPIGSFNDHIHYQTHEVELQKGDLIYLFSDGYADQFGGPKGKKLKYKNLKAIILENQKETLPQQKQILQKRLAQWMGDLEQLDDICLMGIKI